MLSLTAMVFPVLIFVTQQRVSNPQLVPVGSPTTIIGEKFPEHYVANRSVNTLPLVRTMSPKMAKSFSGIIWPAGAGAPAEFRNGKRFKAEPGHKLNGQTLATFLKTFRSSGNLRYSTKQISGFMVKLPGEESKLRGFDGVLSAGIIYFVIKDAKVQSSQKFTMHK